MKRYIYAAFMCWGVCLPEALADVSGRVVVVDKGEQERRVVTDVLVYLEGGPSAGPAPAASTKRAVTSRNKQFEPRVVAVVAGEALTFPNVDDIMHNVFSLTKGNRFDLGLYKSGASKDFVFKTPGLVRIYCNIHPQMSAFVQVRPDRRFAWAEPDGSFRIPDVPPGSYTLRAWHEQGESSQPLFVTEAGASNVMVKLDVSRFKKRPHLNKFGKPYKRKRGKY